VVDAASAEGLLDPRHAFHVVDDEEGYRRALESLPAFLDAVQSGLVQYQAGMDPFEDDPVGGIPGMTAAALRQRDAFVLAHLRRRAIPTVVNLAGGYVEGVSARLHVETIRLMRG
jgi:acetoin utilization deacetylase AcuC-like enzyme